MPKILDHPSETTKKTKEYRAWCHMKERCYNPNNQRYKDYGARGIIVCDAWLNNYKQFLKDMGRAPSPNHSLERLDNNGNYELTNCKWATPLEQANNTSRNRIISFSNVSLTLTNWARKLGINESTLIKRLNKWPIEKALSMPSQKGLLNSGCFGKRAVSILIFCLVSLISFSQKRGGEDRWLVKTLQDPDNNQVNLNAINTTIHYLVNLPSVKVGKNTSRMPAEMQTYRVKAIVTGYFKEGDGDLHIVIADPKTKETMIAEMPDPDCDAVEETNFEPEFRFVRSQFTALSRTQIVGHRFWFTGIAFYDLVHGNKQRGVARNNIELHPIIYFESAE